MPRRNVSVCTYASWAACISRYMASARWIAPKPRKAISTMSMLKPIASTKRDEREYIRLNLDYCDPLRREKYSRYCISVRQFRYLRQADRVGDFEIGRILHLKSR